MTSNGQSDVLLDVLSGMVMGVLLVPLVMLAVVPAPLHRTTTRRICQARWP